MTGFEIKTFNCGHVIDSVNNNKIQQLGLYVWITQSFAHIIDCTVLMETKHFNWIYME